MSLAPALDRRRQARARHARRHTLARPVVALCAERCDLHLAYDLLQDFATISLLTNGPCCWSRAKTLPANDLAAAGGLLRPTSDKASAAPGGHRRAGTYPHLLPEDDRHALRLHPYRGTGPALRT